MVRFRRFAIPIACPEKKKNNNKDSTEIRKTIKDSNVLESFNNSSRSVLWSTSCIHSPWSSKGARCSAIMMLVLALRNIAQRHAGRQTDNLPRGLTQQEEHLLFLML